MHESYKKAMSGVRPSAQCTERIMHMTENKPHRIHKGWLAAAIAAVLLLCAAFTANAATDGALFDGRLLDALRVRIGGQEYALSEHQINVYTTTDENGDTVVRHEYALPNDVTVYADTAEAYTAFSLEGDAGSEVRIVSPDVTEPNE